jgi:hypothetical protein
MELVAALLFVLALTLLVGLFVARPFIQPHTVPSAAVRSEEEHQEHVRSNLLAERDRVLEALHELDFDNALGKIPPEDYPVQRAVLLQTGAEVLRQLDEIEVRAGGKRKAASTEDRIEAAVAAHRADASSRRARAAASAAVPAAAGVGAGGNGANAKDELEEMIASRKRVRTESAAGFCPGCGRPVQKSDKFCSRCGTTL